MADGPDNVDHETKKYEYDIDNPRLTIFGSTHPPTIVDQLGAEQLGAEAFISRFLIHCFKANRTRLGIYYFL